jgi:hypothetical protein
VVSWLDGAAMTLDRHWRHALKATLRRELGRGVALQRRDSSRSTPQHRITDG